MQETTMIFHNYRRKLGLTCAEYVLCDLVYRMANDQWTEINRNDLAEEMGLTKRAVLFMIDRMTEKGYIEKHPETKRLRAPKWLSSFNR